MVELSAPLAPAEEILRSRHSRDQGPVTRSGIAGRRLSVDEAVGRGERPAPACAMVQDAGAPAAVEAQAGADYNLL